MSQALPPDTKTAATQQAVQDCKNLGLLLDKFAPWKFVDDRWDLTMRVCVRRRGQEEVTAQRGGAAKGIWLREQPRGDEIDAILRPATHFDGDLLDHALTRWLGFVTSHGATPFPMEVDYRLVVGFGAEHVLETNLYLHRIYGFPIIPGSAVKGVTRAWAFWEIAEHFNVFESAVPLLERLLNEGKETAQKALWQQITQTHTFADWQAKARPFYAVFGTTDQQGQVIFFDAYPTQAPKLQLDVLNPHYGRYYQGNDPPADYLTPVPTYFLTVAKDSPFQFAVASKDNTLADTAKHWLTKALTELGIGGKTAAGYGYFT